MTQYIEGAGAFDCPADAPNAYVEHLRTGSLSLGTYSIPVGGHDDQGPHAQDEVYLVAAGRATFVSAEHRRPVRPGSTLFVPAGATHRFEDVKEDLALVVFFAPPYSGDG